MNTTENTEQGTSTTESTELVEYQNHVTQSLDILVNISLFNGFFLGAILGGILITLFFKRINP